jgi:hypothetical protein
MRVDALDPVRDRAWLLGVAPDAGLVSPVELRDQVVAALERVVALHPPSTEERP